MTVWVEGYPQSHVDVADPGLLVFEYVQHLAACLDVLPAGPPPRALAVTHVGGAGLTLPRYVEHTRPGSTQIVLEPDEALTTLVRRTLPWSRRHRIRVRGVDGARGLSGLRDASADAVVLDAFSGGQVPAELTTTQWFTGVSRVLRPGGLLLLNLTDEPGLRYVARVAAGVRAVLAGSLVLVATRDVSKGRRFGNVVLAASDATLDTAALRRRIAANPFPTELRDGVQLRPLLAGMRPFTAADAAASPVPPAPGRWRIR